MMITPIPVNVVVAGGLAVGKTTFVSSGSAGAPLTTGAGMADASIAVDDAGGATAMTVAIDVGRVDLGDDLIMYLLGTPDQDRLHTGGSELVRGAIGAVILVDTGRLADAIPAIRYMERTGTPYVVAINAFDGVVRQSPADVRDELVVPAHVPVVVTDARSRAAVKDSLMTLVSSVLNAASAAASPV